MCDVSLAYQKRIVCFLSCQMMSPTFALFWVGIVGMWYSRKEEGCWKQKDLHSKSDLRISLFVV